MYDSDDDDERFNRGTLIGITLALVAILAIVTLSAFAANAASLKDIDNRDRGLISDIRVSDKAPFIGLGVGGHVGGQFTSIDIADEFDGVSADGLNFGAHAEWLFGYGSSSVRFGPQVYGGWSTVNTEIGDEDALILDHYYGAVIKAGVVFNRTLVSLHAGYEWQKWSSDFADIEADTGWWNLGGGIEFQASESFSVGLDVSYLMLNEAEIDGVGDLTDALEDSEAIRAMVTFTFRQ